MRLAGPTARLEGLKLDADGAWVGTLEGPAGRLGVFLARSEGSPRALALELALGFDTGGHLLGVLPLSRGSGVDLLAPGIAKELEALRGLTLSGALEWAEKELWGTGLSAPVWRSVHLVLERVRASNAPSPAPAAPAGPQR